MYQGFEYCEGRALPGREEYLDSEKYEIRVWPDRSDGDIVDEITQLNAIRKANPALQTHMGLAFHNAFNDQVLWYRKSTPDRSNVLLCAVSLDPHNVQEAAVELPLWEWGLPDGAALEAEDLMRGHRFTWHGKNAAHPPRPVRAALRHLARPSGGGRLMPRSRFSEQVRAPEAPATGLAEARRAGGASQVVLKRDDDPQWYRDAVIYQLHVKSFFDSNDDGVGDFAGLLQKLDYIAELGVDTLWLLPFYPSPRKDDGYDIADYRGVHPDYGTLARRAALRARGACARACASSPSWSSTTPATSTPGSSARAPPGPARRTTTTTSGPTTDQKYTDTRIIFLDTEKSNWTWDPVAKAYFWHRFYSHQPDLNFDNPRVLSEVLNVMRFWLDIGVDGLRLDAVPYLVEREGTNNENLPETHEVLKLIRAKLDSGFKGRMLLAEANQWPEDTQQYFGQGDECHMAFHFPLMPRMYMAIAQEDRFPITDILRQTPDIPEGCQWAVFLRNHDELTLEMVTDQERDYLWSTYAADRRARINLGIRRRLSPLLERDRRRIELMNGLLLSMPGTPVIYYGDEIGMGDNIFLGDRDGVRTPMQWSPDRNGGFSKADPARLVLPPIQDPLDGFQAVNVEAQARYPNSLLNWMRRMLAVRRRTRAFGRGEMSLLYPTQPQGAGLSAGARGRHDPLRVQPVPRGAGGGARPVGPRRQGAVRDAGRHQLPARRPAPISAHPAALRLLLVHAGGSPRHAELARTRAGAAARSPHPGHAGRRQGTARARGARRAGARRAARVPDEAPLVRGQGRAPARRAHHRHGGAARARTARW